MSAAARCLACHWLPNRAAAMPGGAGELCPQRWDGSVWRAAVAAIDCSGRKRLDGRVMTWPLCTNQTLIP